MSVRLLPDGRLAGGCPTQVLAEDLVVGDVVDLESFGPLTGQWELITLDYRFSDEIARVVFDARGLPADNGVARFILPADAQITVVRNTTIGFLAAHGLEYHHPWDLVGEPF